MTPESRDAIATIKKALQSLHLAAGTFAAYEERAVDADAALAALEEIIAGEADVRRNHLAFIGQLNARIEALEGAREQAKT